MINPWEKSHEKSPIKRRLSVAQRGSTYMYVAMDGHRGTKLSRGQSGRIKHSTVDGLGGPISGGTDYRVTVQVLL